MNTESIKKRIFSIDNESDFNDIALEIFRFQYSNNMVYKSFTELLYKDPDNIRHYSQIPCIPIEFFKTQKVVSSSDEAEKVFLSSGSTSGVKSSHYVHSTQLYKDSIIQCFELFYGSPKDYIIYALTPSADEKPESSLAFMLNYLIALSGHPDSGFYYNSTDQLISNLNKTTSLKKMIFGLSYKLLELCKHEGLQLQDTIIVETGGMKGWHKEMTREELHNYLSEKLKCKSIHSEYSMTELLSQAYLSGNMLFQPPPWMRFTIRDINDPTVILGNNLSGGINVIDFANLFSCSFIATKDLGRQHASGCIEVLGRYDNSDLRGCNLLSV